MSLRPIPHAFLMVTLAAFSMQVQAQFAAQSATAQPLGMQNPLNAAALQAVPGGVQSPALGAPQPSAPGLVQPALGVQRPDMQRPDIGAADAQRTPLLQQRPFKPQAPSQFQRFVQESTGKLLPHFGSTLFENPMAYAADSAAPAPAEYVLGPGDEVRIQIWGGVDLSLIHI